MSATPPAGLYRFVLNLSKHLSHDMKIILHDDCELDLFWHLVLSMSIYMGTSYVYTFKNRPF